MEIVVAVTAGSSGVFVGTEVEIGAEVGVGGVQPIKQVNTRLTSHILLNKA